MSASADINKDIQALREAAMVAQRYGWPDIVTSVTRLANHLKRCLAEQNEKAAGKQGKLL